jgi:hypothetical protein
MQSATHKPTHEIMPHKCGVIIFNKHFGYLRQNSDVEFLLLPRSCPSIQVIGYPKMEVGEVRLSAADSTGRRNTLKSA